MADPPGAPTVRLRPFASGRALGAALSQVLGRFALSLGGNVVAIVLSVPLIAVGGLVTFGAKSLFLFPVAVAILIGVLPNPAAMGLQALMRDVAYNELPVIGDQRVGLRDYWRIATRAWLISLVLTIVGAGNFGFYAAQASDKHSALYGAAPFLALFWFLLLAAWFAVNFYVAPLLLAQEAQSVKLAYRNAAVLLVQHPLYTWILVTAWLAVLIFSAATGLIVLLGLALASCLQQNGLREVVRR